MPVGFSRGLGILLLSLHALSARAVELDARTGMVIAPGFEVVSVQCTVCHSAKLITQNRADRDGWAAMIRWMQDTQGLWSLGDNEPLVLDYLAQHYGPLAVGRRPPLPPELLPPQ
jgi:hypothetical protein